MTIQQINQYWIQANEKLNTYIPSQLAHPLLFNETISLLINCGLPDSCAPFLSFGKCDDLKIPTPAQYFNIALPELDNYLVIGTNDSGDPICIDLNNNNNTVYLNHDNGFESTLINSSILQMARSIIRYQDFIVSITPDMDDNTFARRKFSDDEFSSFANDFTQIDEKSLSDKTFWKADLDYLLWERDNEL